MKSQTEGKKDYLLNIKTFKNAEYNHASTIYEIRNAMANPRNDLDELLFQILEKFYWKAVEEQKYDTK